MSTSAFARIGTLPGYESWSGDGAASGGDAAATQLQPAGDALPWMRRGRFALALGDPGGPLTRRAHAARAFADAALEQNLEPVLVPVSTPDAYREAGYRLLPIGLTARLDLPAFHLHGRSRHSIRHGVNRARRAGLRVDLARGSAAVAELREVSAAWLASRRLPERRFGTGWFHPALVSEGRVAVVRDASGTAQAFATLIEALDPCAHGEVAVDLMRHRPEAPAGTMDLLLVETARELRREGARVLDLGLCPLAGCNEGAAGRLLNWVYRHGKPWYDFAGLYAFKAKFGPRWERRYVAYRSRRALLPALVTLAELDRPLMWRGSSESRAWNLAPSAS